MRPSRTRPSRDRGARFPTGLPAVVPVAAPVLVLVVALAALAACATPGPAPAAPHPGGAAADTAPAAAPAVWARAMGGVNREYANGIAPAADGGVWVAGHFTGGTELGGPGGGGALRGAGQSDAFVARLDRDGGLAWAGRLGGAEADEAKAVAAAPDGGAYVAGYFSGSADFDPGPGSAELTTAGSGDAFLVRLDAGGRLVWARRFGGRFGDVALGVAADAAGRVYVTGYFQGRARFGEGAEAVERTAAGGTDAFLAALTPEGELRWTVHFGGPEDDEGRAVAADRDGAVFAGRFGGEAAEQIGPAGRAPATARAAGGTDAFAARVGEGGEIGWLARVGGPADDVAHAVAADGAGRAWAAGQFAGDAELGPSANGRVLSSGGRTDGFVVELGAGGRILETRSFGSPGDDFPFGLAAAPGGGAYLAGFSQDVPHPDEARGPRPTGSWVVALDPSLDQRWRRTFDADGGIQVLGLAAPAGEGPRVAGIFEGRATLDLGPERAEIVHRRKTDAFAAALAP